MRPLFPYYGSKWRDARRYPSPRGLVVEPFAGSAGYSLYWNAPRAVLVDADPIIVGVWEYLLRTPAREILSLPDLIEGQSVDDLGLPQEARWFYRVLVEPRFGIAEEDTNRLLATHRSAATSLE